jgi:hypothetical protein
MGWNGTKTETVETVSDLAADFDHRAEAPVLMRSLRVVDRASSQCVVIPEPTFAGYPWMDLRPGANEIAEQFERYDFNS